MKKGSFVLLVGLLVAFVILQSNVVCGEEANMLLERIAHLEKEVQRAKDVNTISNIISKMAYLYEAGMDEERLSYVAKKTPGVAIERYGRGVFEGYESARRTFVDTEKFFQGLHAKGMRLTYPEHKFTSDLDGYLQTSLVCSPVIEVAGDGQTAKAVWVEFMAVSKTYDRVAEPKQHWLWSKLGADFVKEDGEWKIWHYVMSGLTGGDFKDGFKPSPLATDAEEAKKPSAVTGGGTNTSNHGTYPDRPSTIVYQQKYALDRAPSYFPKPPEPYETFNDEDAYVYPSLP